MIYSLEGLSTDVGYRFLLCVGSVNEVIKVLERERGDNPNFRQYSIKSWDKGKYKWYHRLTERSWSWDEFLSAVRGLELEEVELS